MTEQQGTGAPAKGAIPVDSFAHRLRLARAHAGQISIREAADLTGFGRGAWTNWESKGTIPVDYDYVVEVISDKLGVDPLWLADGGQLAEDTTRSRRWSTLRPTRSGHRGGAGVQTTVPKVRVTGQRPSGSVRPRPDRPNNRPPAVSGDPRTRRPALVGSAA